LGASASLSGGSSKKKKEVGRGYEKTLKAVKALKKDVEKSLFQVKFSSILSETFKGFFSYFDLLVSHSFSQSFFTLKINHLIMDGFFFFFLLNILLNFSFYTSLVIYPP